MNEPFSSDEYWRAIVLYGLNTATYKMGLGRVLVRAASEGKSRLPWTDLAAYFLDEYRDRLSGPDQRPQQGHPGRLTVMERTVKALSAGSFDLDRAVTEVAERGFRDVVPRFQSIAGQKELVADRFYTFDYGREVVLTDDVIELAEERGPELLNELSARWALLEGAFQMRQEGWDLSNDLREVYLSSATRRTALTKHVPFLRGYQADRCFYCGVEIPEGSAHVDHLFPRQVVEHDHVWNLVLAHDACNLLKSDQLVPLHYVEKLYCRNENLVGSSHPWRNKIKAALGETPNKRRATTLRHFENVARILGGRHWEGIRGFDPQSDPFYRRLITRMNNS